jgi:tight adherence protein C
MPVELIVTLAAVFLSTALVTGLLVSMVLSRTAPEVRRLHRVAGASAGGGVLGGNGDSVVLPAAQALKKPRRHNNQRLQRRFAMAGSTDPQVAALYSTAQLALPVLFGVVPLLVLGLRNGVIPALVAAVMGYMLPDLWLSRKINQRKRAIQNGLPDALDLLIVCVEAGSSLDQAILRTSEELEIALPPMAHELRTLATEIRAGKPRLGAFQDFAKRTNLDDVRALVTMLIQTDRFGTSIAQALRTHAETSRTRRRQRAEERAAKVGVKLVFPLVLCLLPALYVVCLGPVAVRVYRTLF